MRDAEGRILERFELSVSICLRPCAAEDLGALEWGGLFTHHREIIRDAFACREEGTNEMIVADLGGYPVGQIWVDLERRRAEGAGLLWALRVVPWLSGRGIGGRLLAAAEAQLARRGFAGAEIGVEVANDRAHRLYERAGYVVIGRVCETYSYTPPGGARETIAIDEWMLRKALPRPATQALPEVER